MDRFETFFRELSSHLHKLEGYVPYLSGLMGPDGVSETSTAMYTIWLALLGAKESTLLANVCADQTSSQRLFDILSRIYAVVTIAYYPNPNIRDDPYSWLERLILEIETILMRYAWG